MLSILLGLILKFCISTFRWMENKNNVLTEETNRR